MRGQLGTDNKFIATYKKKSIKNSESDRYL